MKIRVFDTYKKAMTAAAIAWGSTTLIVLGRAFDWIPQQFGLTAVLTLGWGVAASVSISRFRLASAITQVFHLGLTSAITMSANVFTDTAIMQLDQDGKIDDVDHADAIGWTEGDLIGRCLSDILVPRSHDGSVRKIEAGTTITSPMKNGLGGTFDARLTIAALGSRAPETTDRRLVVTVAPVVQTIEN